MTDENKEGLYGNPVNLKAQNMRIIIITVITALLVLGITAWGIIYAVGNDGDSESSDTETVEIATDNGTQGVDDNSASDKSGPSEDSTSSDGSTSSDNAVEITNLNEDGSVKSGEVVSKNTEENIPKTGPEDILPLALVLGMFTIFLGSTKLIKANN